MRKVVTILLMCFGFIIPPVMSAGPGSSLQFESFNPQKLITPGSSSATPASVAPPDASSKPPHEEPIFTDCPTGGEAEAISEYFLFYKRSGMPSNQALTKANEMYNNIKTAVISVFGANQRCLHTIIKAVARVAIKRGEDPVILIQSFKTMTTGQIVEILKKEISTPLYIWSPKRMRISVTAQQPVINSNPAAQNNSWEFMIDQSKLTYLPTEQNYDYLSYDLLSEFDTYTPLPISIVGRDGLKGGLEDILIQSQLPAEYKNSALASWMAKIPIAPNYGLGVFSQKDAEQILPLTISPKPQILYRLVLYVKPLIWGGQNSQPINIEKIPQRNGLSAIDVGIVIDF